MKKKKGAKLIYNCDVIIKGKIICESIEVNPKKPKKPKPKKYAQPK